jgi:outer membrane protein OmpA-like peptidoglycan-associated protein
MDIYKITNLDKFKKECAEKTSSLLTLNTSIIDKETHLVNFATTIPSTVKALAYQWTFNQTKLTNDASQISQNVSNTEIGDSVYVKVIAGCDTCIEPIVLCNYTKFQKPKDEPLVNTADELGKNPYDDKLILAYLNKTKLNALGLNLTPIHFNLNKSNIREDAVLILKNNIDVLTKHPELSILIYGFADSRGAEAYNLPLSKKRAQHVKDYLVSKGIKSSQIEQINGKGETFILNKCTEGISCEDSEHEVNRRVEFVIFEKK